MLLRQMLGYALLLGVVCPLLASAQEGTAKGSMTVNGKAIVLSHAYAFAQPNHFDKEREDLRVILTDKPISDDALRHDRDQLDKQAAAGTLHAIAVTIGNDMSGHGKSADSNDIYVAEINHGWLNTSGLDTFEMTSLDAKALSGRLHMIAPHEFGDDNTKFDYDVTFNAAIAR
ncbi:MAG: hypothetical protein ABI843_10475 [Dokdonella sp.]